MGISNHIAEAANVFDNRIGMHKIESIISKWKITRVTDMKIETRFQFG